MATNKDEAQRELAESKQRGAERTRSQRLSRDIASLAAEVDPPRDSIAAAVQMPTPSGSYWTSLCERRKSTHHSVDEASATWLIC